MSTVGVNLNIPAADGAGTSSSTVAMQKRKTFIIGGTFVGSVIIEAQGISAAGPWCQIAQASAPRDLVIDVVCSALRVRRTGTVSGTPVVDVSAEEGAVLSAALTVPAAAGVGASTDVTTYGEEISIFVGSPFGGVISVEASADNTTFQQVGPTFTGPGCATLSTPANYVRVRRAGSVSGTPLVTYAAQTDLASIDTLDEAYDGPTGAGSGRTITADANAVVITNSAADNNNVLEINKTPSGAQSGDGVAVATSATATGDGIDINNDGTGNGLRVLQGGAGDALNVSIDGAGFLGQALVVTETAVARTTSMVTITRDAAVVNAGAHAVDINNDGSGNSVRIFHGGSADAINVNIDGASTVGQAFVVGESAVARTTPMVAIVRDVAVVGAGAHLMDLNNNGAGHCLAILQGGAGDGINVSIDGASLLGQALVITETAVARTRAMLALTADAARAAAGTVLEITNPSAALSLDVVSGLVRFQTAQAMGGGAAPTLGTIGGSGPAAAAQNEWIQINTQSGARFVPAWA